VNIFVDKSNHQRYPHLEKWDGGLVITVVRFFFKKKIRAVNLVVLGRVGMKIKIYFKAIIVVDKPNFTKHLNL
jgi:hypothetical protein